MTQARRRMEGLTLKPAFAIGTALFIALTAAAHAGDAAPPPDTPQMAAALDLLKANNVTGNIAQVIDSMMLLEDKELRHQNPDLDPAKLAKMENIFRNEFVSREDEYARMVATVYAAHFSVDELQALAAFYRSGVGKKYIATMPAMIKEMTPIGAEWGRRIAADAMRKAMDATTPPPGDHI